MLLSMSLTALSRMVFGLPPARMSCVAFAKVVEMNGYAGVAGRTVPYFFARSKKTRYLPPGAYAGTWAAASVLAGISPRALEKAAKYLGCAEKSRYALAPSLAEQPLVMPHSQDAAPIFVPL